MKSFNTDGDFKNNYKFLIGSIVPRPIALVSTLNTDGSSNLAPFSFFTAVSAKPMIVAFSPFIKSSNGERKDTLINIEREKECVINFVTEDIVNKVNLCSTELDRNESEFEFSKLTSIDSQIIKSKRVKESPIHFECKLRDIISYGEVPGCGSLVTVEVVKVHIKDELEHNGRISSDLYKVIGRGAGNDWIRNTDRFELERLMKTQIQK